MQKNIVVELIKQGELTARECDVLQQVCEGKADKQIAHVLGISVKTVTAHLERIYLKLDVKNKQGNARCSAIVAAFARGLFKCS